MSRGGRRSRQLPESRGIDKSSAWSLTATSISMSAAQNKYIMLRYLGHRCFESGMKHEASTPLSEKERSVLIPGTSTASVVRAHWWHTLLAAAFAPEVLFCSQLKTGFCLRPPPARHNSAHHGSCRTSSRGIRCSDDRPHHHPQVGRRRRRPHRSGGVQTDDMRQVHRVHH